MKIRILSALMSATILLSTLAPAASAIGEENIQPTTQISTTAHYHDDDVYYDEEIENSDFEIIEITGYYEEESQGLDVIGTILARLRSLVADLLEYLRGIFENEEYEAYPVYITAPGQDTLEGNKEAAELCNEFNGLMEEFYNLSANAEITKNAYVDVWLTDSTLSRTSEIIIDEVLDSFLVEESIDGYFEKGESVYFMQDIVLSPEFITSATKINGYDGGYYYEFEVMQEAAYFDGYSTYGIYENEHGYEFYELYHENVADTLHIEYLDIGPFNVSNASILYPGAIICAYVDSEGRITDLYIDMPVEGVGDVSLAFANGTIALEGYRYEDYTIFYN